MLTCLYGLRGEVLSLLVRLALKSFLMLTCFSRSLEFDLGGG